MRDHVWSAWEIEIIVISTWVSECVCAQNYIPYARDRFNHIKTYQPYHNFLRIERENDNDKERKKRKKIKRDIRIYDYDTFPSFEMTSVAIRVSVLLKRTLNTQSSCCHGI